MGTMAAFFRRSEAAHAGFVPAIQADSDPYRLRALPNDDIFFYSKRIDNSRVLRQQDPEARGDCWSAVGAAAVLLMIGGSIIAPHVATVMAGYRLETLKQDQQALLDQKRELEVKEAGLTSNRRLNALADARNLGKPAPDQIVHLDAQAAEGNFAQVLPVAGPASRDNRSR